MATRSIIRLLVLCLAAGLAGSLPTQRAAEGCSDEELKAQVPALTDFHEVIATLWHEAWPEKNIGMMKDLLPKVKEHVAKVQGATLPGILRDRKDTWDAGVRELVSITEKYEQAAASDNSQALIDTVEALHMQFERLVRIVRPAMKELDAYHVELYKAYHHYMPSKDMAKVRETAENLQVKCQGLLAAAVPKRFAAKEPAIRTGFTALCSATDDLRGTAAKGGVEQVEAALEAVHSRYQEAERLFE